MTENIGTRAVSPNAGPKTSHVFARRLLAGAVVIVMCYLFIGASYQEIFQYHPIFMTVAFLGMMPEIVHLANAIRRTRSMNDRHSAVEMHLTVAFLMKLAALAGFVAIFVVKRQNNKSHYTSLHGQIGLLCGIVLFLQVIVGLAYYYRWLKYTNLLRAAHKYLGASLALLGAGSMALGMFSSFGTRVVPNPMVHNLLAAITAIVTAWVYVRE